MRCARLEPLLVRCFYLVLLLPALLGTMLVGAYVSTFCFERAWMRALFHLSVRAWLRAHVASVTRVDAAFLQDISARPRLAIHFVHVATPRNMATDPYGLTTAQRCTVEAALRGAPRVTLWISGADARQVERSRGAWRVWLASLRKPSPSVSTTFARHLRPLGTFAVRAHQFHPTTVGAWLQSSAGGNSLPNASNAVPYRSFRWRGGALELFHPALLGDLVRLDVLESEGGIYLDLDALVVDAALSQLPDGVAFQMSRLPWHPIYGHTSSRHLYELLNTAVLISARPGGRVPRAIATAALRNIERWPRPEPASART